MLWCVVLWAFTLTSYPFLYSFVFVPSLHLLYYPMAFISTRSGCKSQRGEKAILLSIIGGILQLRPCCWIKMPLFLFFHISPLLFRLFNHRHCLCLCLTTYFFFGMNTFYCLNMHKKHGNVFQFPFSQNVLFLYKHVAKFTFDSVKNGWKGSEVINLRIDYLKNWDTLIEHGYPCHFWKEMSQKIQC